MRKTVSLDNGNKIDLYFNWVYQRHVLTDIVLRGDQLPLGELVLDDCGKYIPSHYRSWFIVREQEERAAAYYIAKYPDLAGSRRSRLFEVGFARERQTFGDVIERGRELADVMNYEGDGPFLAIDADNRVVGYNKTARYLVYDIEDDGWPGWYSKDRADERTLRVVPASKVYARVNDRASPVTSIEEGS